MARQEQIFAETIVAMKRASARKDDASDSDDSIQRPTNRGNKLKRKAKFIDPSRLDTTAGLRRKKIRYNGYSRSILCHNPPRVDVDGDVVEQVEDEGSDADLTPNEDDPFSGVQVQELLMPLTAAADLKDHPSLSVPYTSRALEQMIQNVQDMLYREQRALWRLKQMISELRGDQTWMPCGLFETENDLMTLAQFPAIPSQAGSAAMSIPTAAGNAESDHGQVGLAATGWEGISNARLLSDEEEANINGLMTDVQHDAYQSLQLARQDVEEDHAIEETTMISTEVVPSTTSSERDAPGANQDLNAEKDREQEHSQNINQDITHDGANEPEVQAAPNVNAKPSVSNGHPESTTEPDQNTEKPSADGEDTKMEMVDMDGENPADDPAHPTHRMTTRNQARAAEAPSSPSLPSAPSSPLLSPIHPFYLVPQSVKPDGSVGLPHDEADETRRLLIMYIQRQEEVCRGVNALHMGLLKAKKMKDDVLEWCNTEGHVGEMSDGEDWVDLQHWGLELGDLKKGEEVEDEEEQVKGKKTRNRRQVA